MSRIDELISKLCPGGVEFKRLGDVVRIRNGRDYKHLGKGDVPVYGSGGVMTRVDTAVYKKPSVLIPRKGSLNKLYYVDIPFWTVDTIFYTEIGDRLIPRFFYYFLATQHLEELNQAGGIPSLTQTVLNEIRIPVPPAEVQREIVQVLDLLTELETELHAELEARRYQYQHYSRTILEGPTDAARDVRLGDVTDILVGFPFKSSEFTNDQTETALVRGDNIGQGLLKEEDFKRWRRASDDSLEIYELRAGDIILAMDRPWIPAGLKWARINEHVLPALLVQRVARLRSDAKVLDQRFLGCIISSPAFTAYVLQSQTGNTVPHISGGQIEAFQFSLPTLTEQIQIAATLDKFDALMNDPSIGLQAELNARRKQYEYYRDRLLTFKELALA